MTSLEARPLLPRIRRGWDAHQGRFVWVCSAPPVRAWGMGLSAQARYDWRQAEMWCTWANWADLNPGHPEAAAFRRT